MSWRKISIALISMAITVAKLITVSPDMTVEQASVTIAGLVVVVIVGAVFIVTQGKVDLQKVTNTPLGETIKKSIAEQLTLLIKPYLQTVQDTGKEFAEDGKTAQPIIKQVQNTTLNNDGTVTITFTDGTTQKTVL